MYDCRFQQLQESEMLLLMQPTLFSKNMGFFMCIRQLLLPVTVRVRVKCFKLQLCLVKPRNWRNYKKNPPPSEANLEAARFVVKEKGETVSQLKSAKASKQEITASVDELKKAKEHLSKLEERAKLQPGIPQKDGKIDYTKDFFARQAFLTVLGKLQVESFACSLSSIYTFGPTIRVEHSHTSKHLAEFWMVEPEIAFAELEVHKN